MVEDKLANYANQSDIATSTAVTELRVAYSIVGLAVTAMAGTNALGIVFLALVLFLDTEFTASIEAVAAVYGSIGWVLTIEILLFTGFLATAIVDLITVMGVMCG